MLEIKELSVSYGPVRALQGISSIATLVAIAAPDVLSSVRTALDDGIEKVETLASAKIERLSTLRSRC